MMNFFRKYQKVMFIVISVMTIASFMFFGTASTLGPTDETPDREVVKAVDGSAVMNKKLQSMIRFFSYVNPMAFESDFIATGMATILADHYFADIKGEFGDKLRRAKSYSPYQDGHISVEDIWQKFIPSLPFHLAKVKMGGETAETFSTYCRLYLDQSMFPAETLKRVIFYQFQQMGMQSVDPYLAHADFSLFGHETLEDWFGRIFMEKSCIFLINAAKIAEQKGYMITAEEAKADLLQHGLELLKGHFSGKEFTYADSEEFYHRQFQMAGLAPEKAFEIWRDVLLFRRLFDDVGQSIFLDPLAYEQFAAYADEGAEIDLFELPKALQFQDFRTMLKFQLYVDSVAPKTRGYRLPTEFYSIAELEKRAPEFVSQKFQIEVAKVTKKSLQDNIGLKETWEWQLSDEGWKELITQFPILTLKESPNRESRFQALEKIEPELRIKMDELARRKIVDNHPEWIAEAMARSPLQNIQISITGRGAPEPFKEVKNTKALLDHLLSKSDALFTEDQTTYFKTRLIAQLSDKEIMTFEEATQDDWIGTLLDERLKDEPGEKAYADLLKTISSDKIDLSDYAKRRFVTFMEDVKRSVMSQGDESPWLKSSGHRLKDQWIVTKKRVNIHRGEKTTFAKDEAFTLRPNDWSSVQAGATFFQVAARDEQPRNVEDLVDLGQKFLSMDARRLLTKQLLDKFDERNP